MLPQLLSPALEQIIADTAMTKNVTSHTVALAANVASVSAVCLPGCCARHVLPSYDRGNVACTSLVTSRQHLTMQDDFCASLRYPSPRRAYAYLSRSSRRRPLLKPGPVASAGMCFHAQDFGLECRCKPAQGPFAKIYVPPATRHSTTSAA